MNYCSVEEAWGRSISAEKRKKNAHTSQEKNGSFCSPNNRNFSRDLKTQDNHNGPENRFTVEPIQINEKFVSKHDDFNHAFNGIEEDHIPSSQKQENKSSSSQNDNISTSELEWIKEQLRVITEKISVLSEHQNMDDEKKHGGSPAADAVLYISTGILTIFLVDVFLKKSIS